MRLAGLRGFSPSDAFEQDGMDNRQECPRTCHGIVSRRHALNMQMGLGQQPPLQRQQLSTVLPTLGTTHGG
jgi:hypothetical protein